MLLPTLNFRCVRVATHVIATQTLVLLINPPPPHLSRSLSPPHAALHSWERSFRVGNHSCLSARSRARAQVHNKHWNKRACMQGRVHPVWRPDTRGLGARRGRFRCWPVRWLASRKESRKESMQFLVTKKNLLDCFDISFRSFRCLYLFHCKIIIVSTRP